MWRNIHNWNLVACDVKQPISLTHSLGLLIGAYSLKEVYNQSLIFVSFWTNYSFREWDDEAHEPVKNSIWLNIVTPTDRPKLVGNLRVFYCWMLVIVTLNHVRFYDFSVRTGHRVSWLLNSLPFLVMYKMIL